MVVYTPLHLLDELEAAREDKVQNADKAHLHEHRVSRYFEIILSMIGVYKTSTSNMSSLSIHLHFIFSESRFRNTVPHTDYEDEEARESALHCIDQNTHDRREHQVLA